MRTYSCAALYCSSFCLFKTYKTVIMIAPAVQVCFWATGDTTDQRWAAGVCAFMCLLRSRVCKTNQKVFLKSVVHKQACVHVWEFKVKDSWNKKSHYIWGEKSKVKSLLCVCVFMYTVSIRWVWLISLCSRGSNSQSRWEWSLKESQWKSQ